MQIKINFLLIFLLISCHSFSQKTASFGAENSHEFFTKELSNAKDTNFEAIIAQYRQFIAKNPANIVAKIELCKFIGNSYFDEYEGYNLKYEETEECISALAQAFPSEPKVLIYQAENLYGEDKLPVLQKAIALIKNENSRWSSVEIAAINKMMGDYHEEDNSLSLSYYEKAQDFNERLDLSLPIAQIYKDQGKEEKARAVLLPHLEKDTAKWVMNQKANLLLDLQEPEKALYLFDVISEKDSTFIDNSEMAKAMTGMENFETAREFLVRDTVQEWNKIAKLQNLFVHDFAHSDPEVALESYRKLQNESSYDDFFGIKRLKIFFKSPSLNWSLSEFLHLGLLLILILLLFLIPYLWVMPVYGLGIYLQRKGVEVHQKLDLQWSMKHFWIISFLYLFAQVCTVFVFEYDAIMNSYFDLVNIYGEEELSESSLANTMIFYIILMAVFTLFIFNKKNVKHLYTSSLSIRQIIGFAILFVLFNTFFTKLLSTFMDLDTPLLDPNVFLSAKAEILAIMSEYGFLLSFVLVAVVVPIYEETIFRGVILGAVEKYIGFKAANVIQAIMFAAIHYNLKLFPFYVLFALITGVAVKRTGGLLTGIVFHGIHNFFVLLVYYYLTQHSFMG